MLPAPLSRAFANDDPIEREYIFGNGAKGSGRAERDRWFAENYPQATRLVVDDALLRERCSGLGIEAPVLPRNDAPAEEHRALVAWLCMTLLD